MEIIIIAKDYQREEFTGLIAYEIARRAGVRYANSYEGLPEKAALFLEIGGILDRDESVEIYIEDKTRTQAFAMIFGTFFKISTQMPFKSRLERKSNYARLELTNRIRYNKEMRELVINLCSDIVKAVKSCFQNKK